MATPVATASSHDCSWLFDLLWGREPDVTWAPAGELPAGFERAERYAVLPCGGGRTLTVSLAARPGTAAALTAYNALRSPGRRLPRELVSAGLRTGMAQPFLRKRLDVGSAIGATLEQRTALIASEHFVGLFGRAPLVIAFDGGRGPYRKPVLQVFAANGRPLGHVKIGWNPWTREALHREAAALRACALRPIRLVVPTVLDQSSWNGLDLLVTEPLPGGARRLTGRPRLPEIDVLREINALSRAFRGGLASSPWWRRLRERISGVTDPFTRGRLASFADAIASSWGAVPLDFATWHGDLVPWNLARQGGRLHAWDWESSAPDAPVGFDALHFYLQLAFVARRRPLEESARLARRDADLVLEALGLPPGVVRLVACLHLLELFVRHEEARSSTGDVDDAFYPAVIGALEQSVAFLHDLSAPEVSTRSL